MSDNNEMPVANITPFGLRLQPGLKRRVEEAAKANSRSMNAEIAARLEASFSQTQSSSDLADRLQSLEKEHQKLYLEVRRIAHELNSR